MRRRWILFQTASPGSCCADVSREPLAFFRRQGRLRWTQQPRRYLPIANILQAGDGPDLQKWRSPYEKRGELIVVSYGSGGSKKYPLSTELYEPLVKMKRAVTWPTTLYFL